MITETRRNSNAITAVQSFHALNGSQYSHTKRDEWRLIVTPEGAEHVLNFITGARYRVTFDHDGLIVGINRVDS